MEWNGVVLTVKPADVDMAVVGVRLTASVPAGILLPNVSHGQVVTQHVADGDCTNCVAIASKRRRYRHVVVQPVD